MQLAQNRKTFVLCYYLAEVLRLGALQLAKVNE